MARKTSRRTRSNNLRNCEECGDTFSVRPQYPTQKYCSQECREQSRKVRRRKEVQDELGVFTSPEDLDAFVNEALKEVGKEAGRKTKTSRKKKARKSESFRTCAGHMQFVVPLDDYEVIMKHTETGGKGTLVIELKPN